MDKHREFINTLQNGTMKVRPILMSVTTAPTPQLATVPESRITIPRVQCPPLSPTQDKLLANVAFVFERGIYRPFRIVLAPDAPHIPSSELKPSCVKISPITLIGAGPSTPSQLAEWCNNLARSVGVYQPDPATSFFYRCSSSTFTRSRAKAA